MKVLITGGMGVIGAETSRKFVKEGHRPVIFARHRDESLIGDIVFRFDGLRYSQWYRPRHQRWRQRHWRNGGARFCGWLGFGRSCRLHTTLFINHKSRRSYF